MSNSLISFPGPCIATAVASSAPATFFRTTPGGAVRRVDYPTYDLPSSPQPAQTSLDRARSIAAEIQATLPQRRLPAFDSSQPPRSLEPRRYGPGLFLVPSMPREKRRTRRPKLTPGRAAAPTLAATLLAILHL